MYRIHWHSDNTDGMTYFDVQPGAWSEQEYMLHIRLKRMGMDDLYIPREFEWLAPTGSSAPNPTNTIFTSSRKTSSDPV